MTRTGGCLCGAVRYTLADAPDTIDACHCGMCRKWAGGPALGLETTADKLTWEGAENIAAFASSDWAERAFCKICGSHLYYRLTMEGPMQGQTSLVPGSLDDLTGLSLAKEIYIDRKPDGYALAGDHQRMTEHEFLVSIGMAEEGDGA